MVGEPGISDLFHGRESHFDDVFDLSSGDSRDSPHDLVDVHLAVVDIFAHGELVG